LARAFEKNVVNSGFGVLLTLISLEFQKIQLVIHELIFACMDVDI